MGQEKEYFSEVRSLLVEFAIDMQRIKESKIESEREIKESRLETDRLIKESRLETELQFKETDRVIKESRLETERQFKETEKFIKDNSRQIKEHGMQIGGLGNKFGSFTEGMAFPSLEKMLNKKYGTDSFLTNMKHSKHGSHIEVDALAFSNGQKNLAIAIEVKSILKDEHIEQVHNMLLEFKKHFPQYKDFTLYGMIAAVNAKKNLIDKTLAEGLLYGAISDTTFKLKLPRNFKPKEF